MLVAPGTEAHDGVHRDNEGWCEECAVKPAPLKPIKLEPKMIEALRSLRDALLRGGERSLRFARALREANIKAGDIETLITLGQFDLDKQRVEVEHAKRAGDRYIAQRKIDSDRELPRRIRTSHDEDIECTGIKPLAVRHLLENDKITVQQKARWLADKGYRRVSRRFCTLARVDRQDWREYMAEQQAPWNVDEGMDWVRTLGDDSAADHYRRCHSQDKITVPELVAKLVPTSR